MLFELAGKSFLILASALMLVLFCRRSAAATRHFIWLAVLTSLLALPFAIFFVPHWSGPAFLNQRLIPSANVVPSMVTGTASPSVIQAPVGSPHSVPATATAEVAATKPFRWQSIIPAGWAIGVGLTCVIFLERGRRLEAIKRGARPVTNPAILELRDSIVCELRLPQTVRLLETEQPLMPMTWGCWQPAALLPAQAATWEWERLRLVLRHELAHVRRRDCLAQTLAALVCALYWFNPLAWLAAARMRIERERACDDLVVALGETRPSEYAGHLLNIARQYSAAPGGALAVAKRSGLEQRLRALLDKDSHHGQLTRRTALGVTCALTGGVLAMAGWKVTAAETATEPLRQEQIAQLRAFSAIKEKQSEQLAADAGEKITPRFKAFFDAAMRGDGAYITNEFEYFKKHHPQYATNNKAVENLRTSYWSPVLEIVLGYENVLGGQPEYVREFEQDIIQSIPAGSIYFGGTDPGRGLITAFCPSQPAADPFFTLTQNALADGSYLEYLRRMYGKRIYVPTDKDSQNAFNDYLTDAQERLAKNQLKPGEDVTEKDGRIQVSGQVAVMAINALLVKTIFDHNPDHEYYIEESFPLDWMFPRLEPHGLIMKINRAPLPGLSAEIVQRDQDYWQPRVQEMIGGWLHPETPLSTVIDFVDRTYGEKDLSGFTGNMHFLQSVDSQLIFSKLRSAIAGIYAWRAGALKGIPTPVEDRAEAGPERQRMIAAADFAFRQAFALCPYMPETVSRYAEFLKAQDRKEDALSVLEAALRHPGPPERHYSTALSQTLAEMKGQKGTAAHEDLLRLTHDAP
jgi:beta-lactamase regulating signal transducer with metallopeptidase domain